LKEITPPKRGFSKNPPKGGPPMGNPTQGKKKKGKTQKGGKKEPFQRHLRTLLERGKKKFL